MKDMNRLLGFQHHHKCVSLGRPSLIPGHEKFLHLFLFFYMLCVVVGHIHWAPEYLTVSTAEKAARQPPFSIKQLSQTVIQPSAVGAQYFGWNYSLWHNLWGSKLNEWWGSFGASSMTSGFLVFLSELGDRTFFLSALLSAKYSSPIVFSGSSLALCCSTLLSTGIGYLIHRIPSSIVTAIPIATYFAGLLLLAFSASHIWFLCCNQPGTSTLPQSAVRSAADSAFSMQYLRLGIWPTKLRIFVECFCTIFLMEFFDKSMLSTIALAATQNPIGVFIGGIVAHLFVTLIAVILGGLLINCLNENMINLLAGILLGIFGIFTLLGASASEGLNLR